MSKWNWAFGSISIPKFRWAVTAGDQIGDSEDDQKCGDHYIEEGLECHDGDAHRPTPGKNPYFQNDRKGPQDKSKDTSKRDKSEVTKKTKERKEGQEKSGTGPADFAGDRFDHYANQLEEAWESKTGKPLVWNDKRLHELLEMTMRDTAREFSLDSEDLGFQDLGIDYHGPTDSRREPLRGGPKKGYKGRALWRPRTFEKPTTTPKDDGSGRTEKVPPGFRSELGKGLLQKIRDLKGGERGVESDLNWSAESKIMMDRADPKPGDPGCPSEEDLLALNSALPPLPGDSTEGRPCGEGEDPERGHCKGPGGPSSPDGPMSDDPKVLRKMAPPGGGGKPPTPPKGVGLEMPDDPHRKARTATHVQVMKNSDPKDPKRTSWALNKMFGGGAVKQTPKGMGGSSQPMDENIARQQYDDARHTMGQSGWQETSNMGNRTTWSKGGANITMQTGPSGNSGQYTNQFLVHTPKAAPKKRGLFGR